MLWIQFDFLSGPTLKIKQSLRVWYHCIDFYLYSYFINVFLSTRGFVRAKQIICCASNKRVNVLSVTIFYVDDLIILANNVT
jgi:hypothetical protein